MYFYHAMYERLYESLPTPSLFSAPWWLDATCGEGNWGVAMTFGQHGEPIAALPYQHTRIRGLTACITPPLTPTIAVIGSTAPETLSALFRSLPASQITDLSLQFDAELLPTDHPYKISLKYSYILPAGTSHEQVRKGYSEGLRRNIRQSENDYTVTTSSHGESTDLLHHLIIASFAQQRLQPPGWMRSVLPRLFQELANRGCGQILLANTDDETYAGIGIAWDETTCYYLAGGRQQGDKGSSAHALLLDHAIGLAREKGLTFDFEGSMHPGIANFFQSFGATPVAFPRMRRFSGWGKLFHLFHRAG